MAAAHWSDADIRDVEKTIGGEGTPMVAAACVESFASMLGIGAGTAMQLLSDALDLHYRLPRLEQEVESLAVAPWRARRIAAATHALSPQAAAFVEALVLPIADSCGPVKLDRIVTEASKDLRGCDVVALAQYSMAPAAALVAEATGRPVLTTPDSAVSKLKRTLKA